MTALLASAPPTGIDYDPLKDSRHPHAAAAREAQDWLSWFELGGASEGTVYTYQWTVDKLLALFPSKTLADFTDGDLAAFLKTFPPASRNDRLKPLKSWFKWAVKTRRIQLNPVDLLPSIRQNQQQPVDVFTEAEQAALENLAEPDGTLMATLFGLGLRKAEASHLRRRRIDIDRGLVSVIEGAKGGRHRVVPLMPSLAARLDERFTLEGFGLDDYLWYVRPGAAKQLYHDRPIGPSSFHIWWNRCLDAADVTYRKPHTTRHTYATRWRQKGLGLDEIQQLLGHASIATTSNVYVHLKVAEIADRMAAIEARV